MPTQKNLLITVAVIGLFILLALIIYAYTKNSKQNYLPPPALQQTITPTSTPVSKPAPVTISTVQGIVTSLTSSSITITSDGKTLTFSISGTKDFQKVTSGTVAGGDAKTVPSSASELKVGQEVLIIHEIGSTNARSIYIIK